MSDISELFWQASLEDIKQGYVYHQDTDAFICLVCGKTLVNGIIYPEDGQLYEAKKYVQLHIVKEHRSPFHVLLSLNKKLTGLTDHQKAILELFYEGQSDNDVAKALNTGSTSTIRNHRFSLREKQKQAKIFLAIMELLGERAPKKHMFIDIPRSTRQIDERFAITEQKNQVILTAYLQQGPEGPLASFPRKEKKRVAILRHILTRFSSGKSYTESEVNSILKPFYSDYVLLRRLMIEYGFMDRTQDGSSYWVKI